MRNVILIFFALVFLCCHTLQATQAYTRVSYFKGSNSKLSKVKSFKPRIIGQNTVLIAGTPMWSDNIIYLPVSNYSTDSNQLYISSAIYAYDYKKNTIIDSLILNIPGISISASKIVIDNNIFIVGVKGSKCIIYQADRHLKLLGEYVTGIEAQSVIYADVFGHNLRIVCGSANQTAEMYEISLESMLPVSNLTLAKNGYNSVLDKHFLYFFTAQEDTIYSVQCDLTKPDASPVKKSFHVNIPKDTEGNRNFRCCVSDSVAYISYSGFDNPGGLGTTFIALNMKNDTSKSLVVEGSLAYDVLSLDGRKYFFRTKKTKNTIGLQVSELSADLKESESLVNFFFTKSNYAQGVFKYKDDKVILTGHYLVPKITQPSMDVEKVAKAEPEEFEPYIFIGVLSLK